MEIPGTGWKTLSVSFPGVDLPKGSEAPKPVFSRAGDQLSGSAGAPAVPVSPLINPGFSTFCFILLCVIQ